MSEWISVKERLPEGEALLYCRQKCRIRIFVGSNPQVMGKKDKNRVYFQSYGGWRRATHWMPLPSVEGLNDDA